MPLEPASDVVGILLAGGQSRRMGGGDKCLRTIGGKTLLQHAINRLRPQTAALALNANGDPCRFSAYGLPVLPDPIGGYAGPLAGILAGLLWAQRCHPQARWIASAASDTPFFPLDLVYRLREAVREQYPTIALAASEGRLHPVFGLWPTALADDLRRALEAGTRKILDWTNVHGAVSVEFAPVCYDDAHIDPFFNANRPEDLLEAERIAGSLAL